jgi:DNA-binding MarR family transcriptional regulator
MRTFAHLIKIRKFEAVHLSFLETLEDFRIVEAIGHYQENGLAMPMKQLYRENIGSRATVTRRVGRLRQKGLVVAVVSTDDHRSLSLQLSDALIATYARYADLLWTPAERNRRDFPAAERRLADFA